ncbi:hypothetical protein BDY19DRAFT_517456 [Irpex rosettiformis]|uniref:Uncharacterized protein n=1 Tax=Irpex rosettiformis TaxID=378272 RepID=A0ACB8TRV4_9APHY|nr:hypothetical protein BDY19DRAFT_517456 [Irpex rosettiformis]
MGDPSQWHSIRPWRPTLSLLVREITSVSATFILSSPLGSNSSATEPSLASLGITNDSDDDIEQDAGGRRIQIVSDVLSKGLSVKVNGTPWQRVLMKIDDEADEAVIILFGLMPGRQYDVELGIVPNDKIMRGQITTSDNLPNPSERGFDSSQDVSTDDLPEQSFSSAVTSLTVDTSLTPSSHLEDSDNDTPSSPPSFSLEDRRLQLSHTLSLLQAEHATLTGTLKSARREAQKSDASLRAEIEALKRASERSAPAELRARQKARALQEAARQALAAAEQVQTQVEELEESLPGLLQRKAVLEREWKVVEKEANKVRVRREEAEAREKKRTEAKQSELAGLSGRLDRLTVKREKLDAPAGIISDLEERLRRLEEEREKIESDPYGYGYEESVNDEDDFVPPLRDDNVSGGPLNPQQRRDSPVRTQPHNTHIHRKRHSHPPNHHTHQQQHRHPMPPPPIARPDPIQRPGVGRPGPPTHVPPPGPGVIHLHPPRAHSHSVPHLKRTSPSQNGSSTSGSSSSASPISIPASASNLSSKAPAFEPKGLTLNPTSVPFEPRAGMLSISGLGAQPQVKAKGMRM